MLQTLGKYKFTDDKHNCSVNYWQIKFIKINIQNINKKNITGKYNQLRKLKVKISFVLFKNVLVKK